MIAQQVCTVLCGNTLIAFKISFLTSGGFISASKVKKVVFVCEDYLAEHHRQVS